MNTITCLTCGAEAFECPKCGGGGGNPVGHVVCPQRTHSTTVHVCSLHGPRTDESPRAAPTATPSRAATHSGGILSGAEIRDAVARGEIEIDPFEPAHVNPVSVDLTLGDAVRVYDAWVGDDDRPRDRVLDVREEPKTTRFRMAESGYVLRPGVGYLMHTRERVFTAKYVPVLDGKSSVGRLFMVVHVTAGFGDPGFDGQYTLEVMVTHPLRVYAGMRVAQMRFHTIVGEVVPYQGNYAGEGARGPVASRAYRQFRKDGDLTDATGTAPLAEIEDPHG